MNSADLRGTKSTSTNSKFCRVPKKITNSQGTAYGVEEVSNLKRNRSPWLFSNMNTDAIQCPSRWDVADAYWRRQHWRAAVPLAVQQQIPQRNLKTSTSTLKKFLLKRSTFKGPPVVPARRHLRQRAPQNHSSRDINNYPQENSLGFKQP